MLERLQNRRLIVLTLALLMGFAGLACRLVDLQVVRHQELLGIADGKVRDQKVNEPRRGDILDRNGNPLATCLTVKTVCADPVLIEPYQDVVARAVAPLLGCDVAALTARLQLRTRQAEDGRTLTNRYVVLKRKVTMEQWAEVKSAMAGLEFGVDEASLAGPERRFFKHLRLQSVFPDAAEDQLRVYPMCWGSWGWGLTTRK
jgi:cell division protein FtsI/penicillin-binding protein 2